MFTNSSGKKTRKRISFRGVAGTILTLLVISLVSVFLFGFSSTKEITVQDGDNSYQITTDKTYVDEFLAQNNILLRTGDVLSHPLDARLENNDTLVISRAQHIQVTVDGGTQDIYSLEATLGQALTAAGITLGEYDEVTPALESPVTDGMAVTICRIEVVTEETAGYVDFEEKQVARPDLQKGHTQVVQEGDRGWAEYTYRVVKRDGVEISRELLTETVTVNPVDRIVEYGTAENVVLTSRGTMRYKQKLVCEATAYNASAASNGVWAGQTATGMTPQRGVIAVDPNVIPLGSRLYIESSDGGQSWVYGYAVAGDTGGAIKGNRIDLFYDTHEECIQFGRRSATVYVLE